MKIRSVKYNNRRKVFEIQTSGRSLPFPYSRVEPRPSIGDPISYVLVDKELGGEGFTYILESGEAGTVHIEQVL